MLDCALDQIERNRQTIEIARNASDIERIHRSGKIAAVLDIEGSFDLDGDLCGPPRHVPAGLALRAAFRAQLDQQLRRFLLLARQMARPERARPRVHSRDEPPGHGDQRVARFRRRHLAGHRRQQRSRSSPRTTACARSTTFRATCRTGCSRNWRRKAACSDSRSATSSTIARLSTGPRRTPASRSGTPARFRRAGPSWTLAELDQPAGAAVSHAARRYPAGHPPDGGRVGGGGGPRHPDWWAKTTSRWAAISMAARRCRAACATSATCR